MIVEGLDLPRYREIFFDLDGVLLDSNGIKRDNIRRAVVHKGEAFADQFVRFFTENNGLPREQKIARFFQEAEAQKVVRAYSQLNAFRLAEAEFVPGIRDLLEFLSTQRKPLTVFTGGEEEEARTLLRQVGIYDFFEDVCGGPRTKSENYDRRQHSAPILMFGDSESDYQFSKSKGLDFVFVYGYTQFREWQAFFRRRSIKAAIQDFHQLAY